MLLTRSQQLRFWRDWSAVKSGFQKAAWTEAEIETERRATIARAGFSSLTLVDKLAGFDRLLSQLASLGQPANLNAQLRQENMPRHRLLYACRKLADEPYIVALAASDRFKSADWTSMTLENLLMLRNTLADRSVQQHRSATLQRRRENRKNPSPAEPRFEVENGSPVSNPF